MKGSAAGIIITLIILFNLFCLLLYLLQRFWRHDRRLEEEGGWKEGGSQEEGNDGDGKE